MEALLRFAPFALEGQWRGAAAVALVLTGVVIFIGTVYVLLVSVYGWLQAYLVTVIATMAFSIILAAVWLVGIPGTIPGTGPRGTEPYWVVFLQDSQQGQEFKAEIDTFPKGTAPQNDWRLPSSDEHYPGNINAEGELDNIKSALRPALAGYFQAQKSGSSNPDDYDFRIAGRKPATKEEGEITPARIFFKPNGHVSKINPETEETIEEIDTRDPAKQLLVGVAYPTVYKKDAKGNDTSEVLHPAIRVFAYRNQGRVFQAAAEWLLISILLFALHLWWLAGLEKRQKEREAQLAAGTVREPAPV